MLLLGLPLQVEKEGILRIDVAMQTKARVAPAKKLKRWTCQMNESI
jgi:hypothetical protein